MAYMNLFGFGFFLSILNKSATIHLGCG